MVMVFTLVSAVQEKFGEMMEAVRSERRREKERKEEEEKKKEEVSVFFLYKLLCPRAFYLVMSVQALQWNLC